MSAIRLATAFIKEKEGVKLTAYKDSAGVWTIGVGHTGPEIVKGMGCSQAQADEWLEADLSEAREAVLKLVKVTLSYEQEAALISFVFNLGVGAFRGSSLLKRVNEKAWLDCAREFIRWDKAGGKEVRGLLIRRLEEAAMFLKGAR